MFDDCNRLFKGKATCVTAVLPPVWIIGATEESGFGRATLPRPLPQTTPCNGNWDQWAGREFLGPGVGTARPPVGPAPRRHRMRAPAVRPGAAPGRRAAGRYYMRSIMALPKPEQDTWVAPGIRRAKS
jgi:hypothetical protein